MRYSLNNKIMNHNLDDKLKELFEATPDNVGVGYGLKRVGGNLTDEECIVFTVEKKLPLVELSVEDILPSEIILGERILKTDVVQVGKIEPLQYCNPNVPNINNNCYGWVNTPPSNRQTTRPLRGGLSISCTNIPDKLGTLGFFALDTATNALVGVSNNHVIVGNGLYTSERTLTPPFRNEISNYIYQTGEFGPTNPSLIIGQTIRYVPLLRTTNQAGNPQYNQVDGALTSVSQSVVDAFSYRILGLSGTTPMPFATTAEIDNLLGNTTLGSSGRTSGVKQGSNCGLVATSVNMFITVGEYSNGNFYSYFTNCIEFTRQSPNCAYPIYPGDSGSVLMAKIGGIDKIVGLCFAGGTFTGYAARIDNVASQLGIKAWMGETPKYVNPSSIKLVTQPGGSNQNNITCNGKTLWQGGLTNQAYTC